VALLDERGCANPPGAARLVQNRASKASVLGSIVGPAVRVCERRISRPGPCGSSIGVGAGAGEVAKVPSGFLRLYPDNWLWCRRPPAWVWRGARTAGTESGE
jgi:hypothetical protein